MEAVVTNRRGYRGGRKADCFSCARTESKPSFSIQHSTQNQLASTVPCFHPDTTSSYERFLVSSMNSPWNGPWYTTYHPSHP